MRIIWSQRENEESLASLVRIRGSVSMDYKLDSKRKNKDKVRVE